MTYLYSPSQRGFFVENDGPAPADVVPVADEAHAELLAAQATGKRIVPGPSGEPIAVDPPPPPRPTRDDLLTALSARRHARETGGCEWQGRTVATDRETQAKLTAAFVMATASPVFAIPAWKLPNGEFIALGATDIVGLATAVLTHVQASFSAEAAVAGFIEAGDITTIAALDSAFADQP